jgi:xanthine dehydrogenase large subunit
MNARTPPTDAVLAVTAAGTSRPHESARAQVAGGATYVDDMPVLRGTLYAAPILSTVAHGQLRGIDVSAARAMPGVRDVVLAADIPGDPMLAAFAGDEPIFATGTVQHVGQVLGLVVADTVMQARRAARKVRADIDVLPAILTPQQALAAKTFVLPPVHVRRGDAAAALQAAPHRLSGTLEVGGQEHFYLEGQIAYVVPLEQNQWLVHSSTQHPGEVQHWVAHALGLDNHAVRVECRRMGGGFGGKETQAGHMAVWAAIAAHKLRCPVKLRLDRDDDFMVTGKRHPFWYEYTVGFDDDGLLQGLQLVMAANCGFSADLSGPVADRAVFHSDNAYFLADVDIASYRCKTNTQSHTAFRGFGGPQGVILIETILGDVARVARSRPARRAPAQPVRRGHTQCHALPDEGRGQHPRSADHAAGTQRALPRERQAEITRWNAASPVIKRGLALTPVKFGISFTATLFNQAGALVHVYTDGSVQVNHGGTEMGQGLNTKVAQVVADELGIPLRTRAGHRQRHQQDPQCLGHRRIGRHRPQRPGGPVRGPQCARQPGAVRLRARQLRRRCGALLRRPGGITAQHPQFRRRGEGSVREPHPAVERRLLPHPQDPLRQDHPDRPAVLLLCLWRGLHRGGHRHADRREPGAEGGHPA